MSLTRPSEPVQRPEDRLPDRRAIPGARRLSWRLVAVLAGSLALGACADGTLSGFGNIFQGGRNRAALPPSTTYPPAPPPATPAEQPPQTIDQPAAAPSRTNGSGARVALLLPLSGNNAAVGRAMLDAAQLALFEIGERSFTLLPRDTGGTPEGAAQAAEAALADGAQLILGPLFAAEAAQVAPRARARGVHVVSLSNDRSVTQQGAFMLGIAPQTQVDRVLSFARSRGLARFAALVPNNLFGAAIEEQLRATAASAGAEVVAVERYEPSAQDATPVVRRLAALDERRAALQRQRRELERRNDAASREALRRLQSAETAGDIAFDAVLIPDSGDRAMALGPLLAFHDVDPNRVKFLGSALWDDPRLGREPSLVGAWYPAADPEARADFNERFRSVYGREPPRIATLSYDAVALAAVLAQSRGGPDFSAEALANPNGFDGLDGIFRFRPDGTIERGLAVLEVRREGPRIVSPAPKTFQELTR